MKQIPIKWFYLIALAIVWGSTFILMKKALIGIGPYHLGALRIVFTTIFLLCFGYKAMQHIYKTHWKWLLISGFIGSFFPAFFLAIAQTQIDSSVVSILNALVPLNTVLLGLAVFGITSTKRQVAGVIVGFIGTSLLILKGAELNPTQNYLYILFVILSTVMYAVNVNIIKRYLQNVKPLYIVVGNYVSIFIPALLVLYWSEFFTETTYAHPHFKIAIVYVVILALFGTALLKVLYYKLIQISTIAFSSSVTYLIPLVALIWGLLDGEGFNVMQGFATLIILIGVFLSHKRQA
ncbi:MAG: DMT family transporter [Gelidibacter sp.]